MKVLKLYNRSAIYGKFGEPCASCSRYAAQHPVKQKRAADLGGEEVVLCAKFISVDDLRKSRA